MTHEEKIARFESLLAAHEIQRDRGAPWLWQRLWAMGVELPPPYFLPFAASFLIVLAVAGALGSAIAALWLLTAGADDPAWMNATFCVGISAYAIAQATYAASAWRHESKRLGLPRWDQFPTRD